MSERLTLRLWEPVSAYQSIGKAWNWIKPRLIAQHRLVLEIRQETRSDAQNNLLHARLTDVSRQCVWAGEKQDVDTWRRLFTSAFLRMQGTQVKMLPALDGHGVDIVYASTTKLLRAQCADLSTYIMAWGVDYDPPVQWSPASLGGDE
jgi:hypothetical protein